MSRGRVNLEPAFVLHYRAYRDTSLLLDLFTPEHGRISAVARGARGAKSKLKGLLQPFMPLLISWVGKSDLVTLCGAEPNGKANLLQGKNLMSGLYLNEILVRLLHRFDPHPGLFETYQQTLEKLENKENEAALRSFELNLLNALGYAMQLDCEATTGTPLDADKNYYYVIEHGITALSSEEAIADDNYVFLGKTLLSIAKHDWSESHVLQDAKRLMRLAFAPLLNNRPLNSRELFRRIIHET